jgi:phosphatidylglycerol---prolipoprotein diacylglyceryl transferase
MRPRILQALRDANLSWLGWIVPTPEVAYALLVVVLGVALVLRARQAGLPKERAFEACLLAAVAAGVGSRVFYLVTTGAIVRLPLRAWFDGSAGTASWGAYLGAFGALAAYGTWTGLGPVRLLDAGASVAGLSELFGRWSCFLAGDDFGRVSALPWAIRFPSGSPAFQAHVARGELDPGSALSLPVHPMQFYLMANAIVVLALTSLAWRHWRGRPGLTVATFLLVQGTTRFGWEFFRDPDGGGARGLLSTSQWTCLAFVVTGLTLLLWARRPGRSPELSASWG